MTTYHGLNLSTITVLSSEPSPLEFMRHVTRNRPFVIKDGAANWPALKKWNAAYLLNAMSGQTVNVAITPHGNADSILTLPNNGSVFVKPFETDEPFVDVLQKIQAQERRSTSNSNGPEDNDVRPKLPTRYAQTQNDNLRNEYASLFSDIPPSIPFARIALAQDPDAINFWLGNSHSITALHKDNYENIYVQVLGRKHFVLLPPVEAACVNEKAVLAGTYQPSTSTATAEGDAGFRICIDEPERYVPFATWDPDEPGVNATPYSRYSQPLRVTLEKGDMLYLPALWYHKVSQSCNDEGICCAVNYWYDLDFSGGFWSMAGFVRNVGLLSLEDEEDGVQAKYGEEEGKVDA